MTEMHHHNIDRCSLGLLDCEIGGDRVKESTLILELQPGEKKGKEAIFNCDDSSLKSNAQGIIILTRSFKTPLFPSYHRDETSAPVYTLNDPQ